MARLLVLLSYPIAWITFPGVMLRQFGRMLICRAMGVTVDYVKYFQFGAPFGYVTYDAPASIWRNLVIVAGPFFINSLAGFAVGVMAATFTAGGFVSDMLELSSTWLAMSLAKHAFAQIADGLLLRDALRAPGTPGLAKIIGYPMVALIYLGWIASVLFGDILYAAFIAIGFPALALGLT